MYGWRARIGHVAPSRGDTLVYEFYKMFPEGFMMLNTTGTVRQLVDSDFEAQLSRIEEAVQDLVDNNCDSIIFSGSPLFTRLPFGADRELGKKLSDKFGVPVAAGLTAEVEALKAMNCTEARRRHALRGRDQSAAQAPSRTVRLRSLADRRLRRAQKRPAHRPAGARLVQDRQAALCQSARRRWGFHPLPALADDYRRPAPRRRNRQAGDHQQPGL